MSCFSSPLIWGTYCSTVLIVDSGGKTRQTQLVIEERRIVLSYPLPCWISQLSIPRLHACILWSEACIPVRKTRKMSAVVPVVWSLRQAVGRGCHFAESSTRPSLLCCFPSAGNVTGVTPEASITTPSIIVCGGNTKQIRGLGTLITGCAQLLRVLYQQH